MSYGGGRGGGGGGMGGASGGRKMTPRGQMSSSGSGPAIMMMPVRLYTFLLRKDSRIPLPNHKQQQA